MGSSAEAGSSMRSTSGSGASARDAEALLLSAGELERAVLEAILDIVPQGGAAQGALDGLAIIGGIAVDAKSECDVVVDGFGERVRLLEDHADAGAHLGRVDARVVEILIAEHDGAANPGGGNQIVHAVEASDDGALAAAGGSDEGSYLVRPDGHHDVLDRTKAAVEHLQVLNVEHDVVVAASIGAGPFSYRLRLH